MRIGGILSSQTRAEKVNADSYPRDFPARETIKSLLKTEPILGHWPPQTKRIAGRISARRKHSKHIFFTIFDQTGEIQILYKKPEKLAFTDLDGVEEFLEFDELVLDELDLGDCIGAEGTLDSNRHGEPILVLSNLILLAKALREPPDKFHGLRNPEMAYRHRELDLLGSKSARELFKTRSEIVFEIRKYLNARGYIEIETPTLQSVYGGATAKPFITKHNALNQEYYLSISSELYLKRALVGGYDRVYSISRCFRNEGISPEHNPEFTNVEIFATCETYESMAKFTKDLIYSLSARFAPEKDIVLDQRMGLLSEDWPLSRKCQTDETYAEAWEIYADDMEIASGASDLNNPREQESRLKGVYTDCNDQKYNPLDMNYIEALECGLLPVAGVGIGIDRLVMLLTGKTNIRDVILFNTLKG